MKKPSQFESIESETHTQLSTHNFTHTQKAHGICRICHLAQITFTVYRNDWKHFYAASEEECFISEWKKKNRLLELMY